MGDGSLSQDEIDALLQGADDMLSGSGAAPSAEATPSSGPLSPVARDSIADLFSGAMASVSPALSGYLGKNITISNAMVEVKTADALRSEHNKQYVQIAMNFTGGVTGANLIVFSMNDAGVISSLMMGDDSGAPPSELTDAHQSTLQEFVSQMLSSTATHISEHMGRSINTTVPELSVAGNGQELSLPQGNELVRVTYNLNIEGLVNSRLYHIMDLGLARELAGSSGGAGGAGGGEQMQQMQEPSQQRGPQVGISPVKFPPLGEGMPAAASGNINLLLDVPMTLTVELGRTRQLVKDILGLGEGSIIELDKLAGEPVDLLVNGKLIAKGEVVVIDENFGVRVTDIVSPAERLNKIQV